MGIVNGVNELINEHGSAQILRERLLLAKDQNSAQEKRIVELTTQLQESETKQTELRLELNKCQTENKKFQRRIQEFRESHSSSNSISAYNCPTIA